MNKNININFNTEISNEKSLVKNNNAEIVGYVVGEPLLNHTNHDTEYYKIEIETPYEHRNGLRKTRIPVLVTGRDIQEFGIKEHSLILARGRWGSVRLEDAKYSEFLFAKKIMPIDEETVRFRNSVQLDGYLRRKPSIKRCFNKYENCIEKQAESLISIPRPAGKTEDGKDKIKTDTITIAFRSSYYIDAAMNLERDSRISIKGYIDEIIDENEELIKYVVVPIAVTIVKEELTEEEM